MIDVSPIIESREAGHLEQALNSALELTRDYECPPAQLCFELSSCYREMDLVDSAAQTLASVVEADDNYESWYKAANELNKLDGLTFPDAKPLRVAVLGSYTTNQFSSLLRLHALSRRLSLEIYECDFNQYEQEILDPDSKFYQFAADVTILALDARCLAIPAYSEDHSDQVLSCVNRIKRLWASIANHSRSQIIQHNFAIPPEEAFGNYAPKVPGARSSVLRAINQSLAEGSEPSVSIVDCESLSARIGTTVWFDERYWQIAKQAVSFPALPELVRATVAVLCGALGQSKKCLVLDLDNTLWGGVIGEDGLAGIKLGGSAAGDSFVAFQEYILSLKQRGVILAVCSKNDEHTAKIPFLEHPDMKISLDDIAVFVANWLPKSENIKAIARQLDIGIDSLVFVDDREDERQLVRREVPQVDVIRIPKDPAGYKRALAEYPYFAMSTFTNEDKQRADQYKARAEIKDLELKSTSLDDFHAELKMQAQIAPFDSLNLPRIVQLINKTNQFNLTTKRYNQNDVLAMLADSSFEHFYVRLSDRFADHGLIGLLIAQQRSDALEIDSWLMSCRVIGRKVEDLMLNTLMQIAQKRQCKVVRGTFIQTEKNGLVENLLPQFGFTEVERQNAERRYEFELAQFNELEVPIHAQGDSCNQEQI